MSDGTGETSLSRLDHVSPNCAMICVIITLLNLAFIPQLSAQVSRSVIQETAMPHGNHIADFEQFADHEHYSRDSSGVFQVREDYAPEWYSMVTNLPGDMSRFTTGLFQTRRIPLYIGIAGITAGLMTVDNRVWLKERMLYDRSPSFRTFTDDMVWTGDGRFQFGVAATFAAYGFAFDNSRAMRTGSEIAEAILASGTVDQIIKHISGRQRPADATQPGGDWTFFPNPISYQKHVPQYDAFPSGHITSATAMLVVIAENYPELTWFRPVSYVMMGGIAMSLDAYGYHWLSDIPLGIFLGYSFGEIVSHPLAFNLQSSSSGKSVQLALSPTMIPDGVGVGLNLSF